MAFDFPNAPTVGQVYSGYVWDGEKWLTQPAKGSKKNYIINGAMIIGQENAFTAGTTTNYYPADMFAMDFINSGTQTTQLVVSTTPGGSPYRIRLTATATSTVAAGNYLRISTRVEGLRATDLRMGTATAKTATVQFGCKGPAGTYCLQFQNISLNRTYVAEYVIAAGEANTDVVKSVTIALDQTGTWAIDNTAGLLISWVFMCGTTFQTPANVWTTGNLIASSNQFNFMGTGGNTFELFDVSLTEGSTAPPFQVPEYIGELALCQRYYFKDQLAGLNVNGPSYATGSVLSWIWDFPVQMRATPTLVSVTSSVSYTNLSGVSFSTPTVRVLRMLASSTAASANVSLAFGSGDFIAGNARL